MPKVQKKGKYSKAILVHHINHLKENPELALEIYDKEGKRNLISLCQSCHEEEHPEMGTFLLARVEEVTKT